MSSKGIKKTLLAVLAVGLIAFIYSCVSKTNSGAATDAVKITVDGAKNSYKISEELYRSGQPDKDGFLDLEQQGIRSVLNLREYHRNDKKAKETGLHLIHYPMAAGEVTRQDLLNCLTLIKTAPQPIVVHCWHGSDRTGVVCAAYGIVYLGKSVDEAVSELKDGPFGHHEIIYPNLEKLLRSIDWPAFKKELEITIRDRNSSEKKEITIS